MTPENAGYMVAAYVLVGVIVVSQTCFDIGQSSVATLGQIAAPTLHL